MRLSLALLFGLLLASVARAEIRTETVDYSDGATPLQGYVAWDPEKTGGSAPGVLVVHQWLGLTDYEKSRCRQLAELGYVAFALDIYGTGVRPADTKEAGEMSGKYKSDRDLYRRRLNAGLEQLKQRQQVNASQLAAVGYCFGGTGVLELARSGADIKGGVSFHGGLDSPNPEDGKNIRAKLLICHGADDPFVPEKDVDAMKAELNAADVDWQMIYYSNTVHSFTQPMAGSDNTRGAAYNEKSDRRSWESMKSFFDEIFPQGN